MPSHARRISQLKKQNGSPAVKPSLPSPLQSLLALTTSAFASISTTQAQLLNPKLKQMTDTRSSWQSDLDGARVAGQTLWTLLATIYHFIAVIVHYGTEASIFVLGLVATWLRKQVHHSPFLIFVVYLKVDRSVRAMFSCCLCLIPFVEGLLL